MKNLIILLVLLIIALNINAQITPPAIQWQRSLGGSNDDKANSVKQTIDGGYIIAGASQSNNGNVTGNHGNNMDDYWIVKLDSSGNMQWEKSFGGTFREEAYSIEQTKDKGYIIAGRTESNDGNVTGCHGTPGNYIFDYWIVKLDTTGNIQWEKCYGGSGDDEALSINQTNDKGYIITGLTTSNDFDVSGNHDTTNSYRDAWLLKIDSTGNIQWQKCLGGTYEDYGTYIKQTKDGGYIMTGLTYSNDGDVSGNHDTSGYYYGDAWIVKLDSVGNIQWQKCYGGTYNDSFCKIIETTNGGYIAAGVTYSNDGDVTGNHDTSGSTSDCWIVKIDSIGTIQWEKCYGGSFIDATSGIQQTTDGGYIFSATSFSYDGDVICHYGYNYPDYWIVKIDSVGNIKWQQCLGGLGYDWANSMQLTSDGGLIVAGQSDSNNGNVTGNHGGYDYWIVKLGPAPMEIKEPKIDSDISIYPNPSSGKFTVQVPQQTIYIELLNTLGKVTEKRIISNQTVMNFEIKDEGFYIVRIVTDKETITKKIIVNNEKKRK